MVYVKFLLCDSVWEPYTSHLFQGKGQRYKERINDWTSWRPLPTKIFFKNCCMHASLKQTSPDYITCTLREMSTKPRHVKFIILELLYPKTYHLIYKKKKITLVSLYQNSQTESRRKTNDNSSN